MKKILLSVSCLLVFNTYIVSQTPNLQWAKKLGDISNNDQGISVGIDATGNVYSTGKFFGTIDLDPSTSVNNVYTSGDYDIYISKLDASGNFIWGKKIGGTGLDEPTDIAVDAIGNTYISGIFSNTVDFDPSLNTYSLTEVGSGDNFIVKLDPSGNFIWAKQFGNADFDRCTSITLDPSGNVFATGRLSSLIDFDPSAASTYTLYSYPYTSTFVLKLDANGDFIWAKKIGEGTGAGFGNSITTDQNGNPYITGYFYGTADFDPTATVLNITASGNTQDAYIAKLDINGNLKWAKSFGGNNFDEGTSNTIDSKGNVYTTGYFSGTADFDPSNSTTYSLTSAGGNDAFVAKLDSLGNFIWASKIGSGFEDGGSSISIGQNDEVYLSGYFVYICDFNPSTSGTYTLTSNGSKDGFINKMDENGNFMWNARFGAISEDRASSISNDNSGNVYITGFYERTTDFDPSSTIFNLSGNTGNSDAFVLKLNDIGTSTSIIKKDSSNDKFSIYPNPSNGFVNFQSNEDNVSGNIIVTNLLDEIILTTKMASKNTQLNLSDFKKGIYFITIEHNGEVSTKKIIIE